MLLWSLMLMMCVHQILASSTPRGFGCHKIGHTRNISIPNCMEFKITTNACRGYCKSWSLPSIIFGFSRHPVTSVGQCCNIVDSQEVPVEVLCLDGIRNLKFKSATTCACYHCQKD